MRHACPRTHRHQPLSEAAFRWQLNQDAMATEKLAEGIRLFNNDLLALRRTVSDRLAKAPGGAVAPLWRRSPH